MWLSALNAFSAREVIFKEKETDSGKIRNLVIYRRQRGGKHDLGFLWKQERLSFISASLSFPP